MLSCLDGSFFSVILFLFRNNISLSGGTRVHPHAKEGHLDYLRVFMINNTFAKYIQINISFGLVFSIHLSK